VLCLVRLSSYLDKVRESDQVLALHTDIDKLRGQDLYDACSQRALSLGDLNEARLRAKLRAYLRLVASPPVKAPALGAGKGKEPVLVPVLNENNLRFALLGMNMIRVVREAPENRGLQILFGNCKAA
jgi:hypothetical protein